MNVFTHISEWNLPLPEIPSMPLADRLLMVNPAFFDVAYVINPHMEGQIGKVNRQKANNEWQKLVDLYRSLGLSVEVINGEQGLPDMVFCANQTLPFIRPNGEKGVFCAQMHAPERKPEVAFFKAYFARKGYQVRTLPSDNDSDFEGMGDALWHSGRRLLWGGYGFRTGLEVYKGLAQALDVPVLALAERRCGRLPALAGCGPRLGPGTRRARAGGDLSVHPGVGGEVGGRPVLRAAYGRVRRGRQLVYPRLPDDELPDAGGSLREIGAVLAYHRQPDRGPG